MGSCPLCREPIRNISEQLRIDNLVCCKSRCPLGYAPFKENGECRFCCGKLIRDCV